MKAEKHPVKSGKYFKDGNCVNNGIYGKKSFANADCRTEPDSSRSQSGSLQPGSSQSGGLKSGGLKSGSLQKRVCEFLTTIPPGKVVTYGQIAEHLGNRRLARAVGNALHTNPDPIKYPCYKVVNSLGRLSPNFGDGGREVQKRRLENDGVEVLNGRVDLKKYGWNGLK